MFNALDALEDAEEALPFLASGPLLARAALLAPPPGVDGGAVLSAPVDDLALFLLEAAPDSPALPLTLTALGPFSLEGVPGAVFPGVFLPPLPSLPAPPFLAGVLFLLSPPFLPSAAAEDFFPPPPSPLFDLPSFLLPPPSLLPAFLLLPLLSLLLLLFNLLSLLFPASDDLAGVVFAEDSNELAVLLAALPLAGVPLEGVPLWTPPFALFVVGIFSAAPEVEAAAEEVAEVAAPALETGVLVREEA